MRYFFERNEYGSIVVGSLIAQKHAPAGTRWEELNNKMTKVIFTGDAVGSSRVDFIADYDTPNGISNVTITLFPDVAVKTADPKAALAVLNEAFGHLGAFVVYQEELYFRANTVQLKTISLDLTQA